MEGGAQGSLENEGYFEASRDIWSQSQRMGSHTGILCKEGRLKIVSKGFISGHQDEKDGD